MAVLYFTFNFYCLSCVAHNNISLEILQSMPVAHLFFLNMFGEKTVLHEVYFIHNKNMPLYPEVYVFVYPPDNINDSFFKDTILRSFQMNRASHTTSIFLLDLIYVL
ncbi:hypothetical protein ACJX0J_029152 [Zea mays]